MSSKIDYDLASAAQLQAELGSRLAEFRLCLNVTQQQLAAEAGISVRSLQRVERGLGTSLDSFIRILSALRLQANLEALIPDVSIRPIDRAQLRSKKNRRRARGVTTVSENTEWRWKE